MIFLYALQYTFNRGVAGGKSRENVVRKVLEISVKWRIWWSMLFGNHRKNLLKTQDPLKDHMELEIISLDTAGTFVLDDVILCNLRIK